MIERVRRHLGRASGKLVQTLPPGALRDLVVGVLCRQPPELILDVVELLAAYLPALERQRLLTSTLARCEDAEVFAVAQSLAPQLKAQDPLLRVLADHGPPIGCDAAQHVVAASMRTQDPLACFRLWEDLRDLAREHQATIDHVLAVYCGLLRDAATAGLKLTGARVLELGPGHSLLGGALLLALGAAAYDAVDPFPVARRERDLFRALRARLAEVGPWTAVPELGAVEAQREVLSRFDRALDLSGEAPAWDPDRLRVHSVRAEALSLPNGSVDLVLSNAVLEHVRDLDAVASSCARVLAPGGLAVHQVDYRDHRDFTRPWEFLTCSEEAWTRRFETEAFEFTNRLRHEQVLAALDATGLERVGQWVTDSSPLPADVRARLHPEYQRRADLEVLSARVVYRKPAGA